MLLDSAKILGLLATVAALTAFGCSEGSSDDAETGGASNTGGTTGGAGDTGSSAGSAGDTSTGPVIVTPTGDPLYTFDADREGFKFELYAGEDPYVNLAYSSQNPYDTDAELEWSQDEGIDGEPGVLKLTAPYGAYDELIDIQLNMSAAEDFSGKTLRAYLKVEDGFVSNEDAPGGTYIFVKTGTGYVYARGSWINLRVIPT